jgi:hypothetical protein
VLNMESCTKYGHVQNSVRKLRIGDGAKCTGS